MIKDGLNDFIDNLDLPTVRAIWNKPCPECGSQWVVYRPDKEILMCQQCQHIVGQEELDIETFSIWQFIKNLLRN